MPSEIMGQTNQSSSTLSIINSVNNTLGGTVKSEDFSMVVTNYNNKTNPTKVTQTFTFINGSEQGIKLSLEPGSFFLSDDQFGSKPITFMYNKTFSGDCAAVKTRDGEIIGSGKIGVGEDKTCHVDRIFVGK